MIPVLMLFWVFFLVIALAYNISYTNLLHCVYISNRCISNLTIIPVSSVFAEGPRLGYPSDSTSEGADCWVDGYDAGFA
jgi:hypothetical protein